MAIQWPLVLFSLLAGAGGAMLAFAGLSQLLGGSRTVRRRAVWCALALFVIGGLCSVAHLASPLNAISAVTNLLSFSGISIELMLLGASFIAGAAYLVLTREEGRDGAVRVVAVLAVIFGVAIMLLNQLSLQSRKSYTTVTGKSGQISKINLGKVGKYVIALILVVTTFFTSIFPIVSFAFETFLPNPGDYSFLYTGDPDNLTTKWWTTDENVTENGMYGQKGILHNETIWNAFKGTIWVSVCCALLAGTLGTLIGYAVSKNRRSKWANYVNSVAFLPYLMPSIAVGVAFFILFSSEKINLFNTYTILIIVGTIKYIPFASRSSLNSMLQLSGEIEEAAIIQNIPWVKRMTRIIIPIQKSSIISGYLLPFMTCLRELSLFMLLCVQGFILSTTLDYFDEMGLYAFSSGINLILIITILVCNTLVNKVTGASLDKGIGG